MFDPGSPEESFRERTGVWFAMLVLLMVCGLLFIMGFSQMLGFSVQGLLRGPYEPDSALSPDGRYRAYAVRLRLSEADSHLWVSPAGEAGRRVAILPGIVDAVREIHWSPDSNSVVFVSYTFLTAVRLPGYETAQVSLSDPFIRSRPDMDYSTFRDEHKPRVVAELRFPESGVVAYRLEGESQFHTLRLAALDSD